MQWLSGVAFSFHKTLLAEYRIKSLQQTYSSENFERHKLETRFLSMLETRLEWQMNVPANNSCIAVINSLTEGYPLAEIDCSLQSDSMTFLCEQQTPVDYTESRIANEMQWNLLPKRRLKCLQTWLAIYTQCVKLLPYNKRFTTASNDVIISADLMNLCESIMYTPG